MNLQTDKPWSSRSVGAPWQHRFFYHLIRRGGRRPAYLFLYPVVLYYLCCRPELRRRTGPYLKRRFPAHGRLAGCRDAFRLLLSFSRSLVDRALVGLLGPQSLNTEFPRHDELKTAAAAGRGLIILTSHVGCWQAAMVYLSLLRRPVHLLVEQEAGNIDRHYFELTGRENPFRFINPAGFLGGALEMTCALKNGEIVCVMGDRRQGNREKHLTLDFLSAPVKFPAAAWKLAAVTGAPVAILFPLKNGPDRYRIELADIMQLNPDQARPLNRLRPAMAGYVKALENISQKEPYQFFNFYDMWETDA
ncbi:MAG TPA: lipid A biosynthesis acyltransferase [Proteobacteria bacterium]|nr:lipid A biosynthesis acyltransferase [Pseudomonadota bacterium]